MASTISRRPMFTSAEALMLEGVGVPVSLYSSDGSSGSWAIDVDDPDRDSDKLLHESDSDKSTDKPLEKLTDTSSARSGKSCKTTRSFCSMACHLHIVDLTNTMKHLLFLVSSTSGC